MTRGAVIAVAAAFLMAFAGAFGTMGWPFPRRLVYWLVGFLGGTAVSILIGAAVVRSGLFAGRPWTETLAVAVVNTVFYTGAIWLLSRAFSSSHAPGLLELVPSVFAISLVLSAINLLASRRPAETHVRQDAAPPRFLDRLPPKLRGAELYAVEAEDHYLRLHTSRGSDLILMRLSDAVAELDGIEGAQTHRSWWVARDAVTAARRGDGRAVLALKSGVEAPVSRSYAKALRDEGWF